MTRPAPSPAPQDLPALCELRYRYAAGLDMRDWDLLRSVFDDVIVVDLSTGFANRPRQRVDADAWVQERKPLFLGLAASQHAMSNSRLVGDELLTSVRAEHFLDLEDPSAYFIVGGEYRDRFTRTDSGWVIAEMTLTVRWTQGRAGIMPQAESRGRRALRPGT
jgi:hypothetical protein